MENKVCQEYIQGEISEWSRHSLIIFWAFEININLQQICKRAAGSYHCGLYNRECRRRFPIAAFNTFAQNNNGLKPDGRNNAFKSYLDWTNRSRR